MKSTLLALGSLFLAGCQSLPERESSPSATDCVFLQLKAGPRAAQVTPEEARAAGAGHFANMEKLAAERKLLVAGPYGPPKRDPALRGVFILAAGDEAEAQALAATDPGVVAGVFRTECVRMRTRAALAAYLEHELRLKAERDARGEQPAPGAFGRAYVILTAEDGRRARQALVDQPGVLLWGDLADGRGLAILDALDLDACAKLLGQRAQKIGPHVLDPWFASRELEKLPELSRAGR
ncbi:MAG: hypothetical protein JNK02_09910 [Planctomycetes bacterium]|nr:hypothetical protein [Planctomycetota bacterium]